MMNKFLILFLVTIVSNMGHAATSSASINLVGSDLQIISTGTPRVYVYNVSIEGCTEGTTPVLLLGGADKNPLGKELYSALLMAKASGKKVVLQSDRCWSERSMPVLTSMYIQD